jgi:hypothetical protein
MSRHDPVRASLKEGEQYAGLILGKEGAPDHHLILLPGDAEDVTWAAARQWAACRPGASCRCCSPT